ncbi:serine/threonine-protein phosphatase 6 regulatory ankyrin repeat subunit C-like [Haliotis rufescens]|uniref:serine/threonine-protein phosphatase 6 regulatory ankyrin repeat subunit C-like n=1 Tax=Haliotis rufescens TaxID=6454 RepID=UPI00201EEE3F|nr:serine/threonine-protein phosphatase 6 regulatory ankyrin repeat subunit C-like [Haliotis rufescens]
MMMFEAPDSRLYYVVEENDLVKLQGLIDEGRNLDEFYFDDQNISTKSLMHVACEKGRYDCVKLLIDNKASMSVRDKWGQSPLMYSVASRHADVAELLLMKNREIVDDSDSYGKSALHSAAEIGYVEGIRVLVKYGANVDRQMMDGNTALSRAICERDLEDCSETVHVLIEAGADLNIRDRRCKRTALQNAAVKRNIKVVEMLLEAGADTNSLDGAGRTALTNMMYEHVKNVQGVSFIPDDVMTIVVMMVQAGIDLNLNTCEYCNPMMTAANLRAEPLLRLFLTNGADANLTSVMGVSSLLISTSKNDILSLKTLLEWNVRSDIPGLIYKRREDKEYMVDPFELAIMEGHFDTAKILISAGYGKYRKPYLFDKALLPRTLQQNPDMLEWLQSKASCPDSLLNLVLFSCRTLLGRNIKSAVKKLPIPARVRGMIALADLLDIQDDFSS